MVAVAGRVTLAPEVLARHGFSGAYSLAELEPDLARSMARPAELLTRLAARISAEWFAA